MWFWRRRERGVSSAGAGMYPSAKPRQEGLTLKCVWCGKKIKMFVGPKTRGTVYGLCLECRSAVLAAQARYLKT